MTPEELHKESKLQPRLQIFQGIVGIACFGVAILFFVIFNVWASIGLFFAAICQVAIIFWRRSYIKQLESQINCS